MKPFPDPASTDEVAAEWLARQDAGLTAEETVQLESWLASDVRHQRAWAEVLEPWQRLELIRQSGQAHTMAEQLRQRARRRRRWRMATGLAAAAVMAAGISILLPTFRAAREAVPEARSNVFGPTVDPAGDEGASAMVLRPAQRRLEDGTRVEMKEDALMCVHFSATAREVRLMNGTAHFEIVPDAQRPFIVLVGNVNVRAVGTAFTVAHLPDEADILVTSGRVAVSRRPGEGDETADAAGWSLKARDRARLGFAAAAEPVMQTLSEEEMRSLQEWRAPKLRLRGATLAEVAEILNRNNPVRLTIADPTLAELKFSGVFRADNPAGFARMLEGSYGIQVMSHEHDEIVLRRR